MSLPDRIDPRPPRRIYRWDLDKTYLQTEFDTLRQLLKTAMQSAEEKVAVPGAAALIRELKAPDTRLCIISGSPTQMRGVLEEKLKLDGVEWDELVLKDNVRNLLRGRFKALRGQVGYKLPVLLESRADAPSEAEEVLFGDDAEADAYIYSLYGDLIAGRVSEGVLRHVLRGAEVYPSDERRIFQAWRRIARANPVRRIFIHLERLTPPGHFAGYGSRVVPVFNYFQAALVLLADGHLTAPQVLRVAVEMVQTAGYNLWTLSNSFQDMIRRGFPLQEFADPLAQAMEGRQAFFRAVRPVPDILRAFSQRLTALGGTGSTSAAGEIDYLALLSDATPRRRAERAAEGPLEELD